MSSVDPEVPKEKKSSRNKNEKPQKHEEMQTESEGGADEKTEEGFTVVDMDTEEGTTIVREQPDGQEEQPAQKAEQPAQQAEQPAQQAEQPAQQAEQQDQQAEQSAEQAQQPAQQAEQPVQIAEQLAKEDSGTEEYSNVYHVNFYNDNEMSAPCRVAFEPGSAVTIDDEKITIDQLRYASRRPYKGFPQRAAHCVIFSYSDKSTNGVKHVFLEMRSVEDTMQLSESFKKLVDAKFLMTEDGEYVDDMSCFDTICDQPIYFGGSNIKVTNTLDQTVVYEGRCIVVLDIECLSVYPVVQDELGKPFRLMFWEQEGENTVEKILHYHKENKIVFETTLAAYEMPVIEGVVSQLHELQPKAKNVLADKSLLQQWVVKSKRTKKSPTCTASSLYPEIHDEYEAGASARPTRQQPEYTPDWQRVNELQETAERSVMTELNKELDSAVKQFLDTEDIQMYWISVEADLNEIIQSGAVPETDHYSGGLDPNSAEHLKRAVNDIADQLKDQQFSIAVSRVQAARRIFDATQQAQIRAFFSCNDMDLLKKIYFRSLVQ